MPLLSNTLLLQKNTESSNCPSLSSQMEKWVRGPVIGQGSTATVWLGVAESGELLAVKSTDLSSSKFLQREQSLLSELDSPYVVKYVSSNVTFEQNRLMYNLVMEHMPRGTLRDAVRRSGLPEPVIRSHARRILKGLRDLHACGVVHCDLKCSNVLVGEDGRVKIADLGCAKTLPAEGLMPAAGTPAFMAPEVARGEEQGCAADVWAMGCTVIEMATGKCPWPEIEDFPAAVYRIGFSEELPEIPAWLSDKAKDFLGKCLERDHKKRWTVQELLQHPFLDEEDYVDAAIDSNSTSPNAVLDNAFWDCYEFSRNGSDQSVHPESSTSMASSSRLSSAFNRIKNLVGSGNPDWIGTDSGWITVRSNGIEEKKNVVEVNGSSTPDSNPIAPTSWDLDSNSNSYEEAERDSVMNLDAGLVEHDANNSISIHSVTFSTGRDSPVICKNVSENSIVQASNKSCTFPPYPSFGFSLSDSFFIGV